MGVGKQLEDEINEILKKRDKVIKEHVVGFYGILKDESPVDTGELKLSWNMPKRIPKGWRTTNHAPHAVIIDGGRRKVRTKLGNMKEIGSVDLPDGYAPLIEDSDKELNEKLKKT